MKPKKTLSTVEWAPARLLEEVADGISVQDLDMRIRYANRALRDVFGDDIIGKFCYEAYERHSEWCEGCPVKECLATGKPAFAQRVGFSNDGAPWFADIIATPLRNPDGEIVGAVETVRNVTDRKLIEQEADKRHRETAALAEIAVALNSNVELDDILAVALERSVAICGASGGLIRLLDEKSGLLVNRAWYSANNELILEDILPPQRLGTGPIFAAAQTAEILIKDDIRQDKDVTATKHGRALLELGLSSIAIVPLASKGTVFGTLALGSFERAKFGKADKGLLSAIAGQISISIENAGLLEAARLHSKNLEKEVKDKVAELVELELRFKTLVENSNTAILAYDASGRITEANQAAQELLGCRSRDLVGNHPSKIECCPQFVNELPLVLAGATLTGFEHDVIVAGGGRKIVMSNAAPIFDAAGAITGAITTMTDITERKHLEEQVTGEEPVG